MGAVRRWYGVVGELYRLSEQDASFHVKLNFPLDSRLDRNVEGLKAIPAVVTAIQDHGFTPEEFISLTVLVGAGKAALRLERENEGAILTNVDPALVDFFRQHETELQALDSALEAPQ